jgi:3-dehydroshikimate dehydratase
MLHSGLVSITFRKLSAEEVISLVTQAGLEGIEWGGDIHVPHGDVNRAKDVRARTADAGLSVSSYGSYYRVGVSEQDGLRFESVAATAAELGAPVVRVWAGNKGSEVADEQWWETVVSETHRIAEIAEEHGLVVTCEYHGNTLTDTNDGAQRFLAAVDHPSVATYWQPPNARSFEYCLEGLQGVLDRLCHVHAFHWSPQTRERLPLADGRDRWMPYLQTVASTRRDHFVLIEFVVDDLPAQFLEDAATLKGWIADVCAG